MKAFMTNGTLDFLDKLARKHSQLHFYFMKNASSTLAYYESKQKSVFGAGREYVIRFESGQIQEEGYVVMNNIPLTEEGKPVFIDRFKQRQDDINQMPGFQAFRLLEPVKGNTYIIFTQWASEEHFEKWQESDEFAKSHHNQAVKPPAYFAKRPFISAYRMVDEEDYEELEKEKS
ncbi:MAG TPA: antibiotic biosynthesis monooxygenase [Candidatus Dormibacteraeota bacterium]|nr:antibiotic biosynthesis monooxygenase [Candidatus Dormibacteraeota bacterium]